MQRYFISDEDWTEREVLLKDNNAHHITRVMRMAVGEEIICNHPEGKAAICKISQMTNEIVHATIKTWLDTDAELPIQVTIAQGIPKGNKLELIIQKGTELGANGFYLFQADRSIAKWNEKNAEKRINRYEKIMKEASEQCHRNIVPSIEGALTIEQLLDKKQAFDSVMFAYEEEAKTNNYSSLSSALKKVNKNDKILLFIGPEGGFSDREVQLLKTNDCTPVRLGKRILRTETASLYALASISYHFEELGCENE